MGLTALLLTGVGAGISTLGAAQQAKANEETFRYNAQVAEENAAATRADAQAQLAVRRAANKRELSKYRAQFAAANVENTGSALGAQAEAAYQMEFDNQNVAYNAQSAERAAHDEANLLNAQADNARNQGFLTVGGTLLSGASSVAKDWRDLDKVGADWFTWPTFKKAASLND